MEVSLKDLKELFSGAEVNNASQPSEHPYNTGSNYLIRTVTMIYTGKLESVGDKELVLSSAAWIAETERWADGLKNGKFKEVEPYPSNETVIIGRGAILDATVWQHALPLEQK